jgi:hypothetical protein
MAYCEKIIARPELLCGPEASHETGSTDGQLWERPEVVYAVLALAPQLPHLRGVVRCVFEGALADWQKFSDEFAPGSKISAMTAEQKREIHVDTTNDVNESGCAVIRQSKRRAPNAGLDHINAKVRYKRNDVGNFIANRLQGDEEQSFLRRTARAIDAEGRGKKRRLDEAEYSHATVKQNRAKKQKSERRKADRQEKVDKCKPILDSSAFRDDQRLQAITLAHINLQLQWHRSREKKLDGKTEVAGYSKMDKAQKAVLLATAVDRWNIRIANGDVSDSDGNSDSNEGNEHSDDVETEPEEDDINYRD